METILEAHYENGRWGSNRASVTLHDNDHYTFCDGYGDPWCAHDLIHAESMFRDFLANRIVICHRTPEIWE